MKKILISFFIGALFSASIFIAYPSIVDVLNKNSKSIGNNNFLENIDLTEIVKSLTKKEDELTNNSVSSNNSVNNNSLQDMFSLPDNASTNYIDNTESIEKDNSEYTVDDIIAQTSAYITIVIDDCGNTLRHSVEYIELASKYNITFAIMPDSPHATKFDKMCFDYNVNTIIHMPMENKGARYFGEKTIIKTYMDYEQISNILDYSFNLVPHATGINNHTGSYATSDNNTVLSVVKFLKSRDKYFFDSLTAGSSIVTKVAKEEQLPSVKRDIFLDNEDTYTAVLSQWKALIRIAKKNGKAVAIGHYWSDNTFNVLSNELPNLYKEGVITKNIKDIVE